MFPEAFMRFHFRGRMLTAVAIDILPLKETLLDPSWLLFHHFSWTSCVFPRLHEISWPSQYRHRFVGWVAGCWVLVEEEQEEEDWKDF